MAPMETIPSAQPRPVEYSVKVSKLIQLTIPITESGNVSVSPSVLSAGVPGGLTYWSRMRIEKIEAYSDDVVAVSGQMSLQVSPQSGWDQPPFAIRDAGTVGNERARLGFKMGLLDRSRWWNTADVTELCVISTAPDSTIILQASIELISPGL